MRKRGFKLIIVESPVKAKTIEKILAGSARDRYVVLPTYGKLEDLPPDRLGVNVRQNFSVTFEVIPEKEKIIQQIREYASRADEVLIATDPDREGEAIAYSVVRHLPDGVNWHRIEFTAVTKGSIEKALKEKRGLNCKLIKAAYARRVIDRLVGYVLSPIASICLGTQFSVGRVQSPALAWITSRQQRLDEILKTEQSGSQVDYRVVVYYDVFGSVGAASWVLKGEYAGGRIGSRRAASNLAQAAFLSQHRVTSVFTKRHRESPPPPMTTAVLCSSFARGDRTAEDVMKSAQALFERGVITYPRTDSTRISPEAQDAVQNYIMDRYGSRYYKFRQFPCQVLAQDAHECIRPANLPGLHIPDWLRGDWKEIAEDVKDRFVASQMADALYEDVFVKVRSQAGPFKVRVTRPVFDGYRRVLKEANDDAAVHPYLATVAGSLRKDAVLRVTNVEVEERKTSSSALPYTESDLIAELSRKGVGRPSTYAYVPRVLCDRGYVVLKDGKFVPTQKGAKLISFLKANYPWVTSAEFTREVENLLDKVTSGQASYRDAVSAVWRKISSSLPEVAKTVEKEGENYAPESAGMVL